MSQPAKQSATYEDLFEISQKRVSSESLWLAAPPRSPAGFLPLGIFPMFGNFGN